MDIRLDPEATFYEIGTTVLYKASNMPRTSKPEESVLFCAARQS
jgi:hypothetical protein